MNTKIVLIPLLLALAIGGCAVHEGQERHVNPPTLGSELLDLKKAHEQGALDDEEYRELKQALLDGGVDDPRYRRSRDSKKAEWERGHEH